MSTPQVYRERREKLAQIVQDGFVILNSASLQTKSHDTEFPFRQDSNFKYLTNLNEPQACLVMKVEGGKSRDILFLRPKDPLSELWNGKRMGVEQAPTLLDMDQSFSIQEFSQRLGPLLEGHKKIYFDLYDTTLMAQILKANKSLDLRRRKKILKPHTFQHLPPLIGRMRLIKGPHEVETMKKRLMPARLPTKGPWP